VAAKSEVLQAWLRENDMELVDVDILRERRLLYLSLTGPEPPVNIGDLHEAIMAQQIPEEGEEPVEFKIRYTWTQKVSGDWPPAGQSIETFAQRAEAGVAEMATGSWRWELTQYGPDSSAHPPAGDSYTLTTRSGGDFEVVANCGKWKGKYTFGGKSLDIHMNRNWFSGCRDDAALAVFIKDLVRARAAYVDGDRMKITLANQEGIMFFRQVDAAPK
jgi:hypothetical protein